MTDLLTQMFQFGFQQIGGAAIDNFFIANCIFLQVGVDRCGRLAVTALQVTFYFIGDGRITLAGQDIDHSLRADNLRGWCNQWRVAKVFANQRDFLVHFINPVERVAFLQLIGEIGNHAAGYLEHMNAGVDTGEFTFKTVVFFAHIGEVTVRFLQGIQIQVGIVFRALQCGYHALSRRMAGSARPGRQCGIDMAATGLNGFQLAHFRQSRCGMAMQMNREIDGILQCLHEFTGRIRREQSGHILNRNGIATECGQILGQPDEACGVMHGAGGIAYRALCVFAGFLGGFDGCSQVAHIVERVKNAEYVHAVFGCAFDKSTYDIV